MIPNYLTTTQTANIQAAIQQPNAGVLPACPNFSEDDPAKLQQVKQSLVHWLKRADPYRNSFYTLDDSGSGRLLADTFKNIARYCVGQKEWNVYDGIRWVPDKEAHKVTELCKLLGDAYREYADDCISFPDNDEGKQRKKAFNRYLGRWFNHSQRQKIIEDAASVYSLSVDAFDQNPLLLNCRNGTYNLQTLQFQLHNSEDRLTRLADVVYDESARSERFEQFIDEIMCGDKETARFLQKALGYCLSGETYLECMFFLHGRLTRNGKSTLMETVLNVLGDYGKATRPEVIMSASKYASPSAANEGVARLFGVRMTSVPEPDKGMRLNAALIKSLTGNDRITARYLYQNSFEFRPQFKIIVNANNLPLVNDMTLFDSHRIYVIPFNRHFEDNEQDRSLKQTFAQDDVKSAVLNWLIEGYKLLKAEGLNPPASVQASTSEYAQDSDTFKQFLDDCLFPQPGFMLRTADVYARYQDWCGMNHIDPDCQKVFNESLKRIGRVERKCPTRIPGDNRGNNKTTVLCDYRLK